MNNTLMLRNCKIVTPSTIISGDISIHNGILIDIGKDLPVKQEIVSRDMQGAFVLPGFRDQHMHHMYGQLNAEKDGPDGIAKRVGEVARAKARDGVTNFWLAIFGGPVSQMRGYFEGLKKYIDSPENGKEGAKLRGGFVEGTFINTDCRGAQSLEYIFRPDTFTSPEVEMQATGKSALEYCKQVVDVLYDTGALNLVNIVPDYGESSCQLIEHAAKKGIVVGMGHTNCHADQIQKALEKGLSFFVHFTNGPTGHNTKPFNGGGAYEGGVTLPVVKEFILDGFHVDYRVMLDVLKSSIEVHGQTLEQFLFVTDQLLPIREERPQGEFCIGTTIVQADYDKGFIEVVGYEKDGKIIPPPPNTLCGSLSTMDKNLSHYLSIRTQDIKGVHCAHKSVPLSQAILEGAQLNATNQAKLIGDKESGSIEKGEKADLVTGHFTGTDGDYQFNVEKVFVEGKEINLTTEN